MKKIMLSLMSALAAVSIVGNAYGAIEVTTNATATMIAPPVVNFGLGYSQLPDRGDTGTVATVAIGEYRRIGDAVAIAANAGTISDALTTNLTVTAGGTYYGTNLISGLIVTNTIATTTNTVIRRSAVALPLTGLSDADGDVRWFRVPATRNPIIVQAGMTVEGAVITLTDSAGGITVLSSNYDKETFTSGKALYATASATNCTVNVIEQ